MNEDSWLLIPVVAMWAVLALAYALAPWGDMIGYAWVWGAGAAVFAVLAAALMRQDRHKSPMRDQP